jgi:CubicO group peptidase (beta-lactamase class C family)
MRQGNLAADLRPQLEGFVRRIRQETGVPSLAVLVSRGDERVFTVAGSRSVETEQLLEADARYHVGCITKLLLAMVTLELASDGALALDAPVGEYLPELAAAVLGRSVRVAHLLSHTSGYRGTHVLDRSLTDWEGVIAHLRATQMLFVPGSVFSYEHTEALLLGEIVRRTAGRASLAQIAERLFAPLGIEPGRVGTGDARTAGRHEFDARSGRFVAVTSHSPPAPLWLPAFSDYTLTLAELTAVAEAAMGRDGFGLLATSTQRALLTPAVRLPSSAGGPLRELLPIAFGHGTALFREGFHGNTGVSSGQCVGLRFDAATGTTVAVALSAAAPQLRDFVLGTVCADLAGHPPGRVPAPFTLDFAMLEGAYSGPGDACAVVRLEGAQVVCELGRERHPERLRVELSRGESGELVLRSPVPQLSLGFFIEPASRIVGLMVGLSAYRRLPL